MNSAPNWRVGERAKVSPHFLRINYPEVDVETTWEIAKLRGVWAELSAGLARITVPKKTLFR